MPRLCTLFFSFMLCLSLCACAKATPTPLPPADILARTVAKMRALQGFSFVVVRTGAPAYLDQDKTLSISRLEGNYVAPDQSAGQARIVGPGLVAGLKFVTIGDRYWETHYLTGEWWQCPPDWQCFNPRILFDPQQGLQPILEKDLGSLAPLEWGEMEELPGKSLYVVSGQMTSERLYQLSWGTIGPGTLAVRLWVDPATFVIERIRLEETGGTADENSIWTVDFLNFDKVVTITPPPVATPKP